MTVAVGPHARVTNTGSRLTTVQWPLRHPEDVLRGIASDADLLDPDGVAHAPLG